MKTLSLRHALVALAVLGLTVLGTGVGSASALWSDCDDGFNCFFSETEGHGRKWQFQFNNGDLPSQGYNVFTRSGWNRRDQYRACGYAATYYYSANYGRPDNDKENYSGRSIRSNRFTFGACD